MTYKDNKNMTEKKKEKKNNSLSVFFNKIFVHVNMLT